MCSCAAISQSRNCGVTCTAEWHLMWHPTCGAQLIQSWTICLPSFPTNFLSQALTQTSNGLRSEICQSHCSRLNVWLYGFSSHVLCAFSIGKCHCTVQTWVLLRAPAAELPVSQETDISFRTCQLEAEQMNIRLHCGTKLTWFNLGKGCFGWLWLILDQKKRSHIWNKVLPENYSDSSLPTFPSYKPFIILFPSRLFLLTGLIELISETVMPGQLNTESHIHVFSFITATERRI